MQALDTQVHIMHNTHITVCILCMIWKGSMAKEYTATEAAEAIGARQTTVTRWISQGKLQAERHINPSTRRPAWRIKHDDLVATCKGTGFTVKLTEPLMPATMFSDPDSATRDAVSLKVRWPLEQRVEPFSLELFQGYSRFRAVTYTVSIPMIFRLLTVCEFDSFPNPVRFSQAADSP